MLNEVMGARVISIFAAAAALSIVTAPRPADAQTRGDVSQQPPDAAAQSPASEPSPLDGIAFAVGLDGYYAWNTNRPLGGVNLLRAYDVSSNSFSLNQANVIVERAPDVSKGRRAGMRLDLMYGQATETLQGSPANEPRPQVYRQVFQAYGSYIVPVGRGLQVDFGKFASALGFENNYTKDQINYSRSYFFNYLPFYHFGVRSTYAANDRLSLTYWLVNGAQQSEDFDGDKSQAAIVTLKPVPSVSWNVNYYSGHERGSDLHIFDTYASWTKDPIALGVEGDYVTVEPASGGSSIVKGGAAYAQYRVSPRTQLAARYEYFGDRAGLFSGLPQNLQEVTVTATYQVAESMMARGEWRRDSSDHDFFPGPTLDVRRPDQQTFTLGLVWWFGTKRGTW